MANTYITSTSRFKPYTFAEMLQPVQIYTEAYNKLEDELSNLDVLAGDVAGKLNNPKDKELADKALAFQTELSNAMNSFYSKGLNADTKKQLVGLKTRYTKELNPINEAYKLYQEDQKQLTTLKRTHPGLIVEGIGDSVSDYMNGNSPTGLTADTNDIYNKALKEAAGTSSRFSEILNPTSILGNQYYQFKTQQGISQDMVKQLRDVIDNPTSKEAIKYLNTEEGRALYNIVQEQRLANNYDKFSDAGKDRIDASILNGIFSGVSYKEDVDRVSNKGWKDPTEPPTPPIDTSGMYFREIPKVETDGKTATTKIAEDKEFLSTILLNPELLKTNLVDAHTKQAGSSITGYVQNVNMPAITYLDRLKELGEEYGIDLNVTDNKGNINTKSLENAIATLGKKIDSSAIARQSYVLNMTDYDLASTIIKDNITAFTSGSGRNDYSGLKDLNGKYIPNKNKSEYLEGEKSIQFDPAKGIILSTTKDGKVKYSVVDPYVLDGTGTLAQRIGFIQQAIDSGDYDIANLLIKGAPGYGAGIMTTLYNMFNSVPYVQGKTDAKIK